VAMSDENINVNKVKAKTLNDAAKA